MNFTLMSFRKTFPMTTELQTGTKKTKLAAAKKTADIISSRPLKMHGKKKHHDDHFRKLPALKY